MKELSLNILDIIENSAAAKAGRIKLAVTENKKLDTLDITVEDDGSGMPDGFAAKATDPFTTTKNARKFGLGLPLLKEETEAAGGYLEIKSSPGKGTAVTARIIKSHIDRPPMGDLAATVSTAIAIHPEIHFVFNYAAESGSFSADSEELKQLFAPVPLNSPSVIRGIEEYLRANIESIDGRKDGKN